MSESAVEKRKRPQKLVGIGDLLGSVAMPTL